MSQDHPHACGDKGCLSLTTMRIAGSSPRVWGQASKGLFAVPPPRIIPTRVGTRSTSFIVSPYTTDHPHACGDKYC